jgi:hypothetical protein
MLRVLPSNASLRLPCSVECDPHPCGISWDHRNLLLQAKTTGTQWAPITADGTSPECTGIEAIELLHHTLHHAARFYKHLSNA